MSFITIYPVDIPLLLLSLHMDNEEIKDTKELFGTLKKTLQSYALAKDTNCGPDEFFRYAKHWNLYMSGESDRPCLGNGTQADPCCGYWGAKLADMLQLVMTTMRQSARVVSSATYPLVGSFFQVSECFFDPASYLY